MSGEPESNLHDTVAARLQALRAEYAHGENVLRQLDAQLTETREQLLRIAGAITVCEELLAADAPDDRASGPG